MLPIDEAKLQKLLEALEEINVMLQRAKRTCDEAEQALRFRLNSKMEIVE